MSNTRTQFSSRLGFILAAAGSAIGLGNIWGFPTQTASNGGGAFLLVYLIMVFILAYPMLIAELTIGRYGEANPVRSLCKIWSNNKFLASILGLIGITTAAAILSFYAIVAGWLVGFMLSPICDMLGFSSAATWLESFGAVRNTILMLIFMGLTMYVVSKGVDDGIEKWSTRLMPLLIVLMLVMIGYILAQDGATQGLQMYLIPDFSKIDADLIISAMGQAFFSLSLGVCVMMIYGSYLKKDANLPKTALQVALLDTGIAFLAGLLILPAMFVAQHNGVQIYNDAGQLLSSDTLVFQVLPAMFDTMGTMGPIISVLFFLLMIIAALTSSISMIEAPVATAAEQLNQSRSKSVLWIGGAITLFSIIIINNFGALFGLVITATTEYAQPLVSLAFALIVGWAWRQDKLLAEIKSGYEGVESGLFWKIWPWYVRIVCPVLTLLVFANTIM